MSGRADPFCITGPAWISFSAGRSSGYMLWRILRAHGGTLPDDVIVGFCNTGKEDPRSLHFVHECEDRWGVPIICLEYDPASPNKTKIVNHNSFSRNGEPFDALIETKNMLPNRMASYCSIELKIRRMREYCVNHLDWQRWTSVVGYRADEPKRVAGLPKRNAARKDRWTTIAPLAEAGIVNDDILQFWGQNEFDLALPVDETGATYNGNCNHCFKFGIAKSLRRARENPDSIDWWIAKENTGRGRGAADRFRQQYTMAEIKRAALSGERPVKITEAQEDEDERDCACTD